MAVVALALTGCSSKNTNTQSPAPGNNDAPEADATSDAQEPEDISEPEDADQDDAEQPDTSEDAPEDATDPEEDAQEPDSGEPDADDETDAPPKECTQIEVSPDWAIAGQDDVSIAYRSVISPILDNQFGLLTLLFERYNPGPDVGTFELGTGQDDNYGTCAHCVVLPGPDPTRAYFADRGTLELRADPYRRRLEASLTNVRLVEVEVDGFTRASTPIPDGNCVEVPDIEISALFPRPGWNCPLSQYDDGELCHCECGAIDPDCNPTSDCFPLDPDCPTPEPLPVAECSGEQVCNFDPELETTACTETCDWAGRTPCAQGTCIFDTGFDADLCIDSDNRLDEATIGQPCRVSNFQKFCNVDNGFALGYCGPNDVCRSVCDDDAQCTEPDHTCRRFVGLEGLGYCGPEPEDG